MCRQHSLLAEALPGFVSVPFSSVVHSSVLHKSKITKSCCCGQHNALAFQCGDDRQWPTITYTVVAFCLHRLTKDPNTQQRTTIFTKNRYENRCPYIKLLEKRLQLGHKVVMCMADNYYFAVSVVRCEGCNIE